jgi:hypothetical protein
MVTVFGQKPVSTKLFFHKNRGFFRLNITHKKKKTLLTDSIYISADHAINSRYNRPDDGIFCRNVY